MKLNTKLSLIKSAIFDKSIVLISDSYAITDISASEIDLYRFEKLLNNAHLQITKNEDYRLAMIRLKNKLKKVENDS